MRRHLVLAVPAAALAAAALAAAAPLLSLPRAAKAGQQTQFGYIHSLRAAGHGRYVLRFDPAWFLTGYTAERASLEDTGSTDVANDYYIVDETHRLLSYVVPAATPVTVLMHGTSTKRISVAALARRVRSGQEKGVTFWLLIGNKYPTPVLSIDQPYRP
jgi:hypothetical protein